MTGAGSIKALDLQHWHIKEVIALYEVTIGVASICLRDDVY